MGKIFDYFMVDGNWEKYQAIQFYKNLPKAVNPQSTQREDILPIKNKTYSIIAPISLLINKFWSKK